MNNTGKRPQDGKSHEKNVTIFYRTVDAPVRSNENITTRVKSKTFYFLLSKLASIYVISTIINIERLGNFRCQIKFMWRNITSILTQNNNGCNLSFYR